MKHPPTTVDGILKFLGKGSYLVSNNYTKTLDPIFACCMFIGLVVLDRDLPSLRILPVVPRNHTVRIDSGETAK